MKRYPFLDDIIIQGKTYLILASSEQGIIERCLMIWVDASVHAFSPTKKANRLTVSPIRFLHPSLKLLQEIVTFSSPLYGQRFAMEAKIIVIHEAFRIACGLTDKYDYIFWLSTFPSGLKVGSIMPYFPRKEELGSFLLMQTGCMILGFPLSFDVCLLTPLLRIMNGWMSLKRFRRSRQAMMTRESSDHIVNDYSNCRLTGVTPPGIGSKYQTGDIRSKDYIIKFEETGSIASRDRIG
jgi:hypothetical protein